MEELKKQIEELKKRQAEALKIGDFLKLSAINKELFTTRENLRKLHEIAKQQQREKVLSAKIDAICKYTIEQ